MLGVVGGVCAVYVWCIDVVVAVLLSVPCQARRHTGRFEFKCTRGPVMVSLNFRGFLPFRVSINNHVFLRDSLAKVKRPKQQDYESAPNKTTLR